MGRGGEGGKGGFPSPTLPHPQLFPRIFPQTPNGGSLGGSNPPNDFFGGSNPPNGPKLGGGGGGAIQGISGQKGGGFNFREESNRLVIA